MRQRSLLLTLLTCSATVAGQTARPDPASLVVHTLAGPLESGTGGMEVDAAGHVYTADFGATLSNGPAGRVVWRITPGGEVSRWAETYASLSDEELRGVQVGLVNIARRPSMTRTG